MINIKLDSFGPSTPVLARVLQEFFGLGCFLSSRMQMSCGISAPTFCFPFRQFQRRKRYFSARIARHFADFSVFHQRQARLHITSFMSDRNARLTRDESSETSNFAALTTSQGEVELCAASKLSDCRDAPNFARFSTFYIYLLCAQFLFHTISNYLHFSLIARLCTAQLGRRLRSVLIESVSG